MPNTAAGGFGIGLCRPSARALAGLFLAALFALFLSGCAGSQARERGWVGNDRALASSAAAPMLGTPDQRAYVDEKYIGGATGTIRVEALPVAVTHGQSPEIDRLRKSLQEILGAGAQQALKETETFGAVVGGGQPAAFVMRVEGLAHIGVLNGRAIADPHMNDTASKLFAIFTVTETATGKTAAKYTAIKRSDWEYAPRVMEDFRKQALEATRDLALFLEQI